MLSLSSAHVCWDPVATAGDDSTVTVKPPVAALPAGSVAEHDTAVSPTGKVDPDDGVQVTGTDPDTRSWAVASKLTTAPPGERAMTTPSGNDSMGGVVSLTVTENELTAWLADSVGGGAGHRGDTEW